MTVGWRTVWIRFSDCSFSEKVQLSRHCGPHRTKKKVFQAICLCLVRVRKVHVLSTVMFSCTLGTSYCASAPRARQSGGAVPGPAHAPGRFAKAGQSRLRSISAASWSVGVWAVTEPDACRTLALDPNFESFFEINFPFLSKMCDLWFSIRN